MFLLFAFLSLDLFLKHPFCEEHTDFVHDLKERGVLLWHILTEMSQSELRNYIRSRLLIAHIASNIRYCNPVLENSKHTHTYTYTQLAMSEHTAVELISDASLNTTDLDLTRRGLTSLDPLLPHLERLTSLRTLRLSHNNISHLPDDLSNSLPALEFLDISDNPIAADNDLHDALLCGLLSLPRLKHLYATLHNESQEDTVVVTLSRLESFNGTRMYSVQKLLSNSSLYNH